MTESHPDHDPMAPAPTDNDYRPNARQQMYIEANRIIAGLARHDQEADETEESAKTTSQVVETIAPNEKYL